MANVVSNTGPLIALASIGQLSLLRDLFDTICIPPAVLTKYEMNEAWPPLPLPIGSSFGLSRTSSLCNCFGKISALENVKPSF